MSSFVGVIVTSQGVSKVIHPARRTLYAEISQTGRKKKKKRIPGEGHKDQGGIPRTYAERKSSVSAAGEAMHHRTVGHLL